jgi:hypothetical protein
MVAEITTTFRVGRRYRCSLRYPSPECGGLIAEWEPSFPTRRLTKAELADYRQGRDTFFAEIARMIGGNVLIIE